MQGGDEGWKAARRRAAARYQQALGRPAPDVFRRVRIHDLKHTCGRRLRAAGVSLEDRQDILAHKTDRITTPLQCPGDRELGRGDEPDSKLTRNSRENRSPVGRVMCKSLKVFGGKGGTRIFELIPGIDWQSSIRASTPAPKHAP